MGWMVRYDKLDDDQKNFVDNEINNKGNIWIKGFAGSGKSVMLIHALRKKIKSNPDSKVCIVVYTHSLIDMFKSGMNELGMSRSVPVMTYHQFRKSGKTYDYIFCDEVQDFPFEIIQLMSQRCQHVYVAGDSNQSIYDGTVEPEEIGTLLNARSFELTRIYRLTRTVMSAVTNLLPNMGIFSSRRDMTKRDVSIRLGEGVDKNEETVYTWEQASNAAAESYSTAILLPTHEYIINYANSILEINGKPEWLVEKDRWGKPDYFLLNKHFRNHGLRVEYIGSRFGSLQNSEKHKNVILMTYHSAKGMDFENVFLPYLSDDVHVSETLLMVAITRSKMNLFITYSGALYYLVKRFESDCQKIDLSSISKNIEEELDFDF